MHFLPIECCGWTLDKVEKLIRDDIETLAMCSLKRQREGFADN